MKKIIFRVGLILFTVSILLIGCATTQSKITPFPSTINISSPDPNLPKEIAAFSGIWEGSWDGILPSLLAIEKIDSKKAIVVYGWADHPRGRFSGGWVRKKAEVKEGGIIEWGGGDEPKLSFVMGKDFKTIEGEYEFKGGISLIITQSIK